MGIINAQLIDRIINWFTEGKIDYIFYLLFLLLVLWLYKSFKIIISDQETNTAKRIDSALEIYSTLYFQLKNLNDSSDKDLIVKIQENLSKAYVYLPIDIIKKTMSLNYSNKKAIEETSSLIEKEILRLKPSRTDSVSYNFENNDIFSNIPKLIGTTKFKLLLTPLSYSFFSLLFIMFFIGFWLSLLTNDFIHGITLIAAVFYGFIFMLVLISIIYLVQVKIFKINLKNTFQLIIFLVLPMILVATINKYLIFLSLAFLLYYFKYLIKNYSKNSV